MAVPNVFLTPNIPNCEFSSLVLHRFYIETYRRDGMQILAKL